MVVTNPTYFKTAAFIVGTYFLFLCIVAGKPFLAPLIMAMILALLMLPVSTRLEKWGLPRIAASLTNTLFLLLLSVGFVLLISIQLSEFLSDWDKVMDRIRPILEEVQQFIFRSSPLSKEDISVKDSFPLKSAGREALSIVNAFYSFLGDFLLTLIYFFFLLNYRRKFKIFIGKLFPFEKRKEVSSVLQKTAVITQEYIFGKLLMMLFLAIIYSIGMGLTGVSNYIVISILASLLTIVPYIGNLAGLILAIGLGYITNGDSTALIGIIATFTIGQFIESYILQPYVVGNKVNLDPFMTILAVVAGGLLWGISGMILAVPILAIVNVIFGHIAALKPFSFLMSSDKEKE